MAVLLNAERTEIVLSGAVGFFDYEDGFDANGVITALASVGGDRDITLRINSGGGIATEGAAIYSALRMHKGNVAVLVEGIAASAASLIAMAGDTITMAPGAVMMIHDPAGFTMGDAAAHMKAIEALNALGDAYASIYAERTGKPVEEMRDLMRSERWMTAAEAQVLGFADAIESANDNDDEEYQVSAFDYRVYAHAPKRLVALADRNGWKARAVTAAPAAPTRQQKEHSMSDDNTAGDITPVIEPIPAVETPAVEEPVVETPAPVAVVAPAKADPAEIAELCASANVATMAAGLIREGVTLEEARARIDCAGEIRAMVAQAGQVNKAIDAALAEKFIADGMNADQARKALFTKIVAAQSPEVSAHVSTQATSANWNKVIDHFKAQTKT
jgi:ATP-dependent Clp protease, protease subunit